MKKKIVKTILMVFMVTAILVMSACSSSLGSETTAEPENTTSSVTTVVPETETTASPETTGAPDTTETPETTKDEETTEAPHTHSFSEWNTVKSESCSKEGLAERSCSCGVTETKAIAKAMHVFGEWIIDKEASCTEAGSKHRVCTACEETIDSETIFAKGHTEVTDNSKAATCTENGLSEGKHCSVCQIVIKAQEVILATGHTEGEWIVDKAATTSSAGSMHIECVICGETLKTEQIPALEIIEKIEYTVTVVDESGAPMAGVEITFTNSSIEVAKLSTDNNGKALAMLTAGEYVVAVVLPENYISNEESFTVSEANPSVEISLISNKNTPENPDESFVLVPKETPIGVLYYPSRSEPYIETSSMLPYSNGSGKGFQGHVYCATDSGTVKIATLYMGSGITEGSHLGRFMGSEVRMEKFDPSIADWSEADKAIYTMVQGDFDYIAEQVRDIID